MVQGDIPLTKRPFREIAELIGADEQAVLETLGKLIREGIIRKIAGIIRHQKAGYDRNALVLWAVPHEQCESVGPIFASYNEITHCYERIPAFEEKYTIFTMLHFKPDADENRVLDKISRATGIKDFIVLWSQQEYKKSSMIYF